MRWQGNEQSGNLEDRRSRGPSGPALGGIGILLILVVGYFLGIDPRQLQMLIGGVQQVQKQFQPAGGGKERELSPEELEQQQFNSTILRFTERVWSDVFAQMGKRYVPPKMVLFSDRVDTGCGTAPSQVGPFYCPADRTLYLDPTFFDELAGRLGGSKAEFSQAYVIAHEVGHHVQTLLGYNEIVDQHRRGPDGNEWSVRLELQADYLAGVWAYYGQQEFKFIEDGDIEAAIQSATAIGDDRLQKRSTGFVSPEGFTHGTSAQRVKWFTRGIKTGDLKRLDELFDLPYESL